MSYLTQHRNSPVSHLFEERGKSKLINSALLPWDQLGYVNMTSVFSWLVNIPCCHKNTHARIFIVTYVEIHVVTDCISSLTDPVHRCVGVFYKFTCSNLQTKNKAGIYIWNTGNGCNSLEIQFYYPYFVGHKGKAFSQSCPPIHFITVYI